jgi:hypothetical protein
LGEKLQWKRPLEKKINRRILLENLCQDLGVEFLKFGHLANGNITVMRENVRLSFVWGITFIAQRRDCRKLKTASALASMLREQGYSDRAVAEICRWYVCSTTDNTSGIVVEYPKN